MAPDYSQGAPEIRKEGLGLPFFFSNFEILHACDKLQEKEEAFF